MRIWMRYQVRYVPQPDEIALDLDLDLGGLGSDLVSLSIASTNSIVGGAFTATFTFGENVSGFVIGDISVTNGSASVFAGSGDTYTATITPTTDGDVTVSVAEGAATGDVSGLNSAAKTLVVEYTTDARELENDEFRVLENGDIRLLESA